MISALAGWKGYVAAGIAAILLCAGGAVAWTMHGNSRYDDGYTQAQTEARLAAADLEKTYREREQEQQRAADAKLAQAAHNAQTARDAADAAAANADGLQRTIAAERAAATKHSSGTPADVARVAAPWDVLKACTERYRVLGRDADSIIENFRAVQGWAEVIDPTGHDLFTVALPAKIPVDKN